MCFLSPRRRLLYLGQSPSQIRNQRLDLTPIWYRRSPRNPNLNRVQSPRYRNLSRCRSRIVAADGLDASRGYCFSPAKSGQNDRNLIPMITRCNDLDFSVANRVTVANGTARSEESLPGVNRRKMARGANKDVTANNTPSPAPGNQRFRAHSWRVLSSWWGGMV